MPRTEPAPKDGKSDSDKDSSDDSSDDSSESGDTVASKKSAEASKDRCLTTVVLQIHLSVFLTPGGP